MKSLVFKLVIPVTIISFTIFTKWWYVYPVDWTPQMWHGFPFPYTRPRVNSLEFYFSIKNFLIDFIIYFVFWFVIIISIDKMLIKIRIKKSIVIAIWSILTLHFMNVFLGFYFLGKFEWKPDLEKEIMETGYQFIWEDIEYPDFYKYHPEKKKD